MNKKEFKEYLESVISGERPSNNLKDLARAIAGRKFKQLSPQDRDIETAKAKRAVKDAVAQAKKEKPTDQQKADVKRVKAATTANKITRQKAREDALVAMADKEAESRNKKTYKIKKGDTLSEIAEKNDTTVAALAKKNNIKDPDKIYAGKSLKLNKGGYANCGASVPPNRKSKS